jgi:hypothetical protein
MAPIRREVRWHGLQGRSGMRRTGVTFVAAAFAGWLSLIPAHAAPPTVTPSPGYDARLQEQRAASHAVQQPVAPVVTPVSPPRPKKTHKH